MGMDQELAVMDQALLTGEVLTCPSDYRVTTSDRILLDMVSQNCRDDQSDGMFFSGFISAHATAMRYLCHIGLLLMDHDGGGRVVYAREACGQTWTCTDLKCRVHGEAGLPIAKERAPELTEAIDDAA